MTSQRDYARIAIFKAQTQAKIDRVIDEYAQGAISHDQFQAVYLHHMRQLEIAELADEMGSSQPLANAAGETMMIKHAAQARALGVAIQHHRSGRFLEVLGAFQVERDQVTAHLHALAADTHPSAQALTMLPDGRWLALTRGAHTTAIILFSRQPSPRQCATMTRLHADFETANAAHLSAEVLGDAPLALPFVTIIQQTLRK